MAMRMLGGVSLGQPGVCGGYYAKRADNATAESFHRSTGAHRFPGYR
jgi:hypothetical protein